MPDKKRGFSPSGIREKLDDYHGSCQFFRTKPDMKAKDIQSLNIDLTFEEALRLSTALQAGILQLNRYDRRDKGGREMGLSLSVKANGSAISVIETRIQKAKVAAE